MTPAKGQCPKPSEYRHLSLVNPEAWERTVSPMLLTAIAIASGIAGSGILVAASSQAMAAFNFDRDDIVVVSVNKLKI